MSIKLFILFAFILSFISLFIINDHIAPQQNQNKPSYLQKITGRPVILCHRGSRYMGVENTISMYEWALKLGCDVIEFDIRLTKDDVVVVYHDSTVNRTTNSHGYIRDFEYKNLINLDPGYHYTPYNSNYESMPNDEKYPFRGKGLKIPTLEEVLIKFSDKYMNIEIKDNDRKLVDKLWAELKRLMPDKLDNIIVASRWCEALSYFREISNNKIATSACEKEALYFFLTTNLGIQNIFYSFVYPEADLYQIPSVSSGLQLDEIKYVNAAHKLGQKIMYWVINNKEHMKRLIDLGADGIVTDRPDIVYNLLYKLGLVKEDKFSLIDKKYINSVEGFFVPDESPYEIHTCVSLICKVIPLILNNLNWILVNIFILILFLLRRKTNETPDKKKKD